MSERTLEQALAHAEEWRAEIVSGYTESIFAIAAARFNHCCNLSTLLATWQTILDSSERSLPTRNWEGKTKITPLSSRVTCTEFSRRVAQTAISLPTRSAVVSPQTPTYRLA